MAGKNKMSISTTLHSAFLISPGEINNLLAILHWQNLLYPSSSLESRKQCFSRPTNNEGEERFQNERINQRMYTVTQHRVHQQNQRTCQYSTTGPTLILTLALLSKSLDNHHIILSAEQSPLGPQAFTAQPERTFCSFPVGRRAKPQLCCASLGTHSWKVPSEKDLGLSIRECRAENMVLCK